MPVRKGSAEWKGSLAEGSGELRTASGVVDASYTAAARFETDEGTNPEELIGAAHAACFSMALAAGLSRAGHVPDSIRTEARVHLEKGDSGFSVTKIELSTEGRVPGISEEAFREHAEGAKAGCPISRALAAVDIRLEARLL
jgi:lipoyl-dependent peroxiredoxin